MPPSARDAVESVCSYYSLHQWTSIIVEPHGVNNTVNSTWVWSQKPNSHHTHPGHVYGGGLHCHAPVPAV